MNKFIITTLLALVTLAGWAQEKPDTITINFQLASKIKGEMVGVLYPDFMDLGTSTLEPASARPTAIRRGGVSQHQQIPHLSAY